MIEMVTALIEKTFPDGAESSTVKLRPWSKLPGPDWVMKRQERPDLFHMQWSDVNLLSLWLWLVSAAVLCALVVVLRCSLRLHHVRVEAGPVT